MRSDPSGGRLPRLCRHGIPGEDCLCCEVPGTSRSRWWHIHRDPGWQLVGTHRYHQCRCGARCVTEAYANQKGPVAPGWPTCRDKHGQATLSSGWVMPPAGGWETPGYPESQIRMQPSRSPQRVIDIDPPEYDVLPPGCM